MPLGHATCVATGAPKPRYLISTPTMVGRSDDVSDTLNVALACAAALQMVQMQNALVAREHRRRWRCRGSGANTGKVPVEICADLMWTAYNLVRSQDFKSFHDMRVALEAELGALGNDASTPAPVATKAPSAPGVKGPYFPPKGPVIPPKGPVVPPKAVGGVVPKPKALADFDDTE
jgi:hypothetical protein